MKNLKIVFSFFLLSSFLACDSLDEVYDELDAANSGLVRDIEYTLIDDDYDLVNRNFGTFNNEDDAKENIPTILDNNFPQFGKGSSAIVTYDIFNGSSPDLRGTYSVATVSDQDYQDLGFNFGNFSNVDEDVETWANWKYPNAEDGDYADVTFVYWAPGNTDATSRMVYTVAYGWKYTMILDDDLYGDFFGESGIDFSFSDEGKEKMPVYLNYLLTTANDFNSLSVEAGKILLVQYNFDDRCFEDNDTEEIECPDGPGAPNVPDVGLYIYNGTEWLLYDDAYQVTPAQLSFGQDGNVWVPDNTVKYPLGFADFQAIAAAYATLNPAGSGSMANFGNYDLTLWSSTEIFDSITDRLLDVFPAVEGQKYLVSYAVWRPGAGTDQLYVIYEGGEYIVFNP